MPQNPATPNPAAPGAHLNPAPAGQPTAPVKPPETVKATPTSGPTQTKLADGEKKEPKAKKEPKPKKEGAVARPRLPKYADEHLITVLKPNAKARGAADRFKGYQTGMTVKAYVDKMTADFERTSGQTYADMRWDEDHKFIHVGPDVVPVPPPEPAKPAEAKSATTQPAA
jgi:hypothetical protein